MKIDLSPRTHEALGTGAIVGGYGVVARGSVQARIRPAVVPIDLAVDTGVAVNAVTSV